MVAKFAKPRRYYWLKGGKDKMACKKMAEYVHDAVRKALRNMANEGESSGTIVRYVR